MRTQKQIEKARKKKEREALRKEKARIKKENHIPTLKKEADRLFSNFIRNRDNWTCQTCGLKVWGSNAHCSHFIGRNNIMTRYDEQNCICQCARENMFMEGNKPKFALILMRKYGTGIIEELVNRSEINFEVDAGFFKMIIEKYK